MKNGKLGLASLVLGCCLFAGNGRAYVTSATLEYSADDEVGFWLNGKLLMKRSDFVWNDYAVLSTSDGSLPLYYFNMNGDNVLAVANYDTEGGHMGVSYRLTVHHSSGDPVVVWSEPGLTKFLHLRPDQKPPQGWEASGYDDSAWGTAIEGNISKDNQWIRWPCLKDEAFGLFGSEGCVPFVSHVASGRSNGHDLNLLRSHLKFPNTPAKVRMTVHPPKISSGQTAAIRLIPGKDAAYFERFQLFARVPKGLKVTSLSKGGYIDPKSSAAFWDYDMADSGLGYVTLNAKAVLSADGWSQPHKVLGPPKAGKVRRQLNTPLSVFEDGAKFNPGNPGWFAMSAPVAVPEGAEILGVIFHSQVRLGGTDSFHTNETDQVYLNYSVDGTQKGSLPEDRLASHTAGAYYWVDGYYDATEDRKWSWAELSNLRVKFEARQRRVKNTARMASVSVVVRYFKPLNMAPYFYAMVDDAVCQQVQLLAGIRQPGQPAVGSDPTSLILNQGLCPPTPVPTATPFATATPVIAIAPTPEPTRPPLATPVPLPTGGGGRIELGCLQSAPEPFKRGGVYIYFCLDDEADVTLFIFNPRSGDKLRSLDAGHFRKGNQQLFFNGIDDKGKMLKPGEYLYEIRVKSASGALRSRNDFIHKVKD